MSQTFSAPPFQPRDHATMVLARGLRTVSAAILVGIVAFLVLVIWAVPEGDELWTTLPALASGLGAAGLASAWVYAATWLSRTRAVQLEWLGYGYMILVCAAVATFRHALPWASHEGFRDVSCVGVVLLACGTFLGGEPRAFAAAALVGAAMDAVALEAWVAFGAKRLPLDQYAVAVVLSPMVGAGLGIAARVHRLHTERSANLETLKVGGWRLLERCDDAKCGSRWRARHESRAREAWVRVLSAPEGSGPSPEVFEEVRAVQRLASPNLLAILEVGITPSGSPFCATELVSGPDLRSLVREVGPLDVPFALHILLQLCEALAEAHHGGRWHRDLRPSFVYLTHFGSATHFVKLMGLGFGDWLSGSQHQKDPQERWERAAFMAPERLAGDAAAGPSSDVYSLGAIGYWLLAARAPFLGSDPAELAVAHASESPVPPSVHRAHSNRKTDGSTPDGPVSVGNVPPALDRLILMCLQKDPRDRPRDAGALLKLLRPIGAVYPFTPPPLNMAAR